MPSNDYIEIFSQVDDERREGIIKYARSIDYAEDASRRLAETNMAVNPFPVIPKPLIGLIQVILPGDPDRPPNPDEGAGTSSVKLTRAVHDQFHKQLTPYLCADDIYKLMGNELIEYWSYVTAYLAYMRHQLAYRKALQASVEARYKFLKYELRLHYEGVVNSEGKVLKKDIRDAYINNDPELLKYSNEAAVSKAMVDHLVLQNRSLEDVQALCSRLLTNLHKEMEHLGGPPGTRSRTTVLNRARSK
jgi:hypothetical protein